MKIIRFECVIRDKYLYNIMPTRSSEFYMLQQEKYIASLFHFNIKC